MIEIIVRGAPNTGKTTAASLIKAHLEEVGYLDVVIQDQPSSSAKPDFTERLAKNQCEPVRIMVQVLSPVEVDNRGRVADIDNSRFFDRDR